MSNRNNNRIIRTNGAQIYKEKLKKMGIKKIQQYTTPILNELTAKKRGSLERVRHIWTTGDRLYKLASKYYGDPELWWLIAWYNQKPTESHFKLGQTVLIPLPLEDILGYYYRSDVR